MSLGTRGLGIGSEATVDFRVVQSLRSEGAGLQAYHTSSFMG